MFFLVIGMMMVPYQVMIIPIFSMIVDLKWLNSYQGLIVPFLFQSFLVFLMRQFFMTVPRELEEAAEVDGLNKIGIFTRIMLPLSKGAICTQIIFSFTGLNLKSETNAFLPYADSDQIPSWGVAYARLCMKRV
ncbi:binding-protein-dependent transport system inner membrane protein [Paenibacillus macerans]|nr:binding-protein-dependent transport system inner membrane protein [Paenibacillus macerans]